MDVPQMLLAAGFVLMLLGAGLAAAAWRTYRVLKIKAVREDLRGTARMSEPGRPPRERGVGMGPAMEAPRAAAVAFAPQTEAASGPARTQSGFCIVWKELVTGSPTGIEGREQ